MRYNEFIISWIFAKFWDNEIDSLSLISSIFLCKFKTSYDFFYKNLIILSFVGSKIQVIVMEKKTFFL